MTVLRIGIGQINTRVGDFEGNLEKIEALIEEAAGMGIELMIFPEMALPGYPMNDLAFSGSFIKAGEEALARIARNTARKKMIVVLGAIESDDTLYNSAAVIHDGEVRAWARKRYLFCCGEFDETRYFSAGEKPLVIETENFRAAVTIGDDLAYPVFPAQIEILINLWNEPYQYGHRPIRGRIMNERAREDAVAIAMVSPVGGQDEMIFEGSSKLVDGFGEVQARGAAFSEDLVAADLDLRELKAHRQRVIHSSREDARRLKRADRARINLPIAKRKRPPAIKSRKRPLLKGPHEIFTALALATRDFVEKNGAKKVVLGVSGGIDSALLTVIAREALSRSRVTAVSMPGPYTSAETRRDAKKLASNLGVRFLEIPIKAPFQAMIKSLAPAFKDLGPDVTEENLQARIRGQILMSIANKYKALVLAAGNKSEAATGYCTLYGDTCGAFAPLVDVYKTRVYEIAAWYNKKAGKSMIPESIIDRLPSAELKPGQTDQDVLPPYPVLDRILEGFLEQGLAVSELIESGEDPETVDKVLCMLMDSAFKRRQSPIGPTVSGRPLSDFRLPLTKRTGWWFGEEGSGLKGCAAGGPKKKRQPRKRVKKK